MDAEGCYLCFLVGSMMSRTRTVIEFTCAEETVNQQWNNSIELC